MEKVIETRDAAHAAAREQVVVETRAADGEPITRTVDPRGYVARSLGIVGLLTVALIHLLDSGSQLQSAPYIFWLYMALMAGSLIVAASLLHTELRAAWIFAGLLAGLTIIGFCLSRTVGLPGSTDDIGNWGQPLGVASLFVEGCVVALSIYRLVLMRESAMTEKQVR